MVPEGHGKDRRRQEANNKCLESYKSEVGPAITTRQTLSRTKGALGVFNQSRRGGVFKIWTCKGKRSDFYIGQERSQDTGVSSQSQEGKEQRMNTQNISFQTELCPARYRVDSGA